MLDAGEITGRRLYRRDTQNKALMTPELNMPSNPVVYFEIGCHNGPQTREFFANLFDWDLTAPDAGMVITTGRALSGDTSRNSLPSGGTM